MDKDRFLELIDDYLEANWGQMLTDLATMVAIPSIEDPEHTGPGAPFGPASRQALDTILDIAQRMGFQTDDGDGYMGSCTAPGKGDATIGVISHVDVVPPGEGWHSDPFSLESREGFLLGRGVIDDKGPGIVALHAMNLVKDTIDPLPYSLQFLFGAGEETGMSDVTYYIEHAPLPTFLFTPDADFPVCNGEKGHYQGILTSPPLPKTKIIELEGGTAVNAVPALAHALLEGTLTGLPDAEGIQVSHIDGNTLIQAQGHAAHASTPEKGVNAIARLLAFLLENAPVLGLWEGADLEQDQEHALSFLELASSLSATTDGSCVGLQAEDSFFGSLTAVVGTIHMEDGRIQVSIDCRYPSTIDADIINRRLGEVCEEVGGHCIQTYNRVPFLVDEEDPCVQALLDAYNQITGEGARTFTMGGATYARCFPRACSFGIEKPWVEKPEWAGGMHGPDEAIEEDLLKEAFKIYALALWNLMGLDY